MEGEDPCLKQCDDSSDILLFRLTEAVPPVAKFVRVLYFPFHIRNITNMECLSMLVQILPGTQVTQAILQALVKGILEAPLPQGERGVGFSAHLTGP